MSSHLPRIAGTVLAALAAVAVIDVQRSFAEEVLSGDVISTTCGAGTLEKCGDKPIEDCDWDVSFSLNFTDRSFGFHLKQTDCKVTGTVPIYKDNTRDSYALSGSCSLLSPFLGMPSGSGCS